MTGMHAAQWSVVIPVKRLRVGKSRLRAAPADDELVLAIALDTVAAARSSHGVDRLVVVTGDPTVAAATRGIGADVVRDPGGGLNAAIMAGAAAAGVAAPRAALLADLPALRGDELSAALRAIGGTSGRGYVADHTGTGTTLLGALAGIELEPRFGRDSAAAHAATGAVALDGRWPGLRLDVDTADDLAAARRLGLGPRTGRALGTTDPERGACGMIDAVC
jgi:2-phospho-L-lactate guanylyltransferase